MDRRVREVAWDYLSSMEALLVRRQLMLIDISCLHLKLSQSKSGKSNTSAKGFLRESLIN